MKEWPGRRPKMSSAPIMRKATRTTTLMSANQYSNSPKLRTRSRLMMPKRTTQMAAGIHGETLNQEPMKPAAPVISAPRTATVASQ